MSTMNISLPDDMKAFADAQVGKQGYGTLSEYVRDLIRRDQERLRLREILLAGAQAPVTGPGDAAYFETLRARVARRRSKRR